MVERAPYERDGRETSHRPRSGQEPAPPTRLPGSPSAARALALQRAAGNRAAARVLSRWSAHPDKDKKGQFMTDEMATSWNKFNPPLSK
jgi:hypothetical protein